MTIKWYKLCVWLVLQSVAPKRKPYCSNLKHRHLFVSHRDRQSGMARQLSMLPLILGPSGFLHCHPCCWFLLSWHQDDCFTSSTDSLLWLKKEKSKMSQGKITKMHVCWVSLFKKQLSGKPNLATSTYISLASSGHLAPFGLKGVWGKGCFNWAHGHLEQNKGSSNKAEETGYPQVIYHTV